MGKNHALLREPGLQVGPFCLPQVSLWMLGRSAGGRAATDIYINHPPSLHTATPLHLQLLIIPTQRPKLSKGILSHERYPAKSSPNTTLI